MRESWEREKLREGLKRGVKERSLRQRELKGVGGRKFERARKGGGATTLSLKQLYTVSTKGRSSR